MRRTHSIRINRLIDENKRSLMEDREALDRIEDRLVEKQFKAETKSGRNKIK